jgi:hypothetical protein
MDTFSALGRFKGAALTMHEERRSEYKIVVKYINVIACLDT